jgi:hypothetical protein
MTRQKSPERMVRNFPPAIAGWRIRWELLRNRGVLINGYQALTIASNGAERP